MLKGLCIATLVFASGAPAQPVTPYRADSGAQAKGDPNRIICKKEEQIGSRLAIKKVCLTVGEWEARAKDDRDRTESLQGGTRARCSLDSQEACDPSGPF